ncbi:endonuclease domain-containing protein [uncultured Chryseobacterium sp.]|uniref:endonuclease domain-containing protein n=1 Tax=uncultured Chryseobacterium sp. TaxID=259322 RepID=UPI0025D1F4ED|nr:endonuclease domain-containing protein [uncultured Chryseobacterium sp.]
MMKSILTYIHGIPIRINYIKNLPYNPKLKQFTSDKRKAGFLSEVLFWKQVRAREFHKIDFDRQKIIGNYIVDFYIRTLGLVIEIDGWSHDNNQVADGLRQKYLESLGLKVFRIADFDVRNNISVVMKDLEDFIVLHYKVN